MSKGKKSINACVLGMDEVAWSMFLAWTSSEVVTVHTDDDESAEAMFKTAWSCKCYSDLYECKC